MWRTLEPLATVPKSNERSGKTVSTQLWAAAIEGADAARTTPIQKMRRMRQIPYNNKVELIRMARSRDSHHETTISYAMGPAPGVHLILEDGTRRVEGLVKQSLRWYDQFAMTELFSNRETVPWIVTGSSNP